MKMKESEDNVTSVKERAKKKLERDMGPLLMTALNDPELSKSCLMLTAKYGKNVWAKNGVHWHFESGAS